jgi:hypothetical protein
MMSISRKAEIPGNQKNKPSYGKVVEEEKTAPEPDIDYRILVGPQGPQGPTGRAGEAGPKGEKGILEKRDQRVIEDLLEKLYI